MKFEFGDYIDVQRMTRSERDNIKKWIENNGGRFTFGEPIGVFDVYVMDSDCEWLRELVNYQDLKTNRTAEVLAAMNASKLPERFYIRDTSEEAIEWLKSLGFEQEDDCNTDVNADEFIWVSMHSKWFGVIRDDIEVYKETPELKLTKSITSYEIVDHTKQEKLFKIERLEKELAELKASL